MGRHEKVGHDKVINVQLGLMHEKCDLNCAACCARRNISQAGIHPVNGHWAEKSIPWSSCVNPVVSPGCMQWPPVHVMQLRQQILHSTADIGGIAVGTQQTLIYSVRAGGRRREANNARLMPHTAQHPRRCNPPSDPWRQLESSARKMRDEYLKFGCAFQPTFCAKQESRQLICDFKELKLYKLTLEMWLLCKSS